MAIFSSQGVILSLEKSSEKQQWVQIFLKEYGILNVKKEIQKSTKNIDIGNIISCEILTKETSSLHKISGIKVLGYYHTANKSFSEIQMFLQILKIIKKYIPYGYPHFEIYEIVEKIIWKENKISFQEILLLYIKILDILWIIPEEIDEILILKIISFIRKYWIHDFKKLKKMDEEQVKTLENFINSF